MRLTSVVMLALAATVMAGCDDDDVTAVPRPPLAGVRIINATTDGVTVDVRSITQVEWIPFANSLGYRQGTIHFPTEAKTHRIRVFRTSTDAAVTSVVQHETDISFQANTKVTLLLTGSVAAGTLQFQVINDDISPTGAGEIAVRLVNTSGAAIDGHLVAAADSPLLGTPTWSNVGSLTASAYVARAAGAAAVRVTPAGVAAATASAAGPVAQAAPAGEPSLPAAGVTAQQTRLSAYFFPAAGAQTTATVIWYVDRNPAD